MEQSVNFFRLTLNSNQGKHALEYLKKRGLSSDAIERFEIGFAPADQTTLTQKLIDKGYDLGAIIETGMSVKSDESKRLYDRFRGRIMFPIRDGRGRCIAFGGRSLDPAAAGSRDLPPNAIHRPLPSRIGNIIRPRKRSYNRLLSSDFTDMPVSIIAPKS